MERRRLVRVRVPRRVDVMVVVVEAVVVVPWPLG